MKIVLVIDHVKENCVSDRSCKCNITLIISYYNNVLLLTIWFRQEKMSNSINDKNFLVEPQVFFLLGKCWGLNS